MRSILFFVCLAAADATKVQDNTISEVVSLLQEMLDKSKADGKNDRELYAKFKCFCDTTTDEKTKAIADAQEQIETLNALLADLRGQNEKLSMEVAHLQQSMDENEAAREEATELREKEKEDFEKRRRTSRPASISSAALSTCSRLSVPTRPRALVRTTSSSWRPVLLRRRRPAS